MPLSNSLSYVAVSALNHHGSKVLYFSENQLGVSNNISSLLSLSTEYVIPSPCQLLNSSLLMVILESNIEFALQKHTAA